MDATRLRSRKVNVGLYITEMKPTILWEVTTCILTDVYFVF